MALLIVALALPAIPASALGQGSLALISPLPELPVGGGTFYVYAALRTPVGYEPLPQTYLVVESSNSSVLAVQSGEISGSGYLAIPVTPVSPGVAVLTVSAPALGLAANATIRVGYAVGYPERVSLQVLPPNVLHGEAGSALVELQDAYGNPAVSGSGVEVHLYEYPYPLASHSASVYIPPGSYFSYGQLLAGNSSGTTYLVGAAQGLAPSQPAALGVGREEPRLLVTLMPNSTYLGSANYVIVLVQAVDPSGRPLVANFPIEVYLTSSNSSVLEPISGNITIPPGSDHAWTEAEVVGAGSANITAQAQWLLPGSASFTSMPGSAAPEQVVVYGPSAMALGQTYPIVVAAASGGYAVSGDYQVFVTSVNPGLASPSSVEVASYSNSEPSTDNLTALGVGTTEIVASSPSMAPGELSVRVYRPGAYMGGEPYQLALYGPEEVLSGTSAEFYVQLQTSYGSPAPAQQPVDVLVQFYPSPGHVGPLPSPEEVVVPAGSSEAPFNVTIGGSGPLTILASAEGLQPASLEVSSLQGPAPVQVKLEATLVPPQPLAGASPMLYLYLEDPSGDLVSPWEQVNVTVVGPGFSEEASIPAGGFYAEVPLPSLPQNYSWYLVAYSGQLGTSLAFNYSYVPVNLTVKALSGLGRPLEGISFNVTKGGSLVASLRTGPDGAATVSLPPGQYAVEMQEGGSPSEGVFVRLESSPNGTSAYVPLNLTSPALVIAYYQVYYQVTVLTPHGVAQGSGIFPEGSIDLVSVRPTRIIGFPSMYYFVGWTGTASSTSPSLAISVNSPQLLIAEWKASLAPLYVVISVVVVGALAAALLLINRRPAQEAQGV